MLLNILQILFYPSKNQCYFTNLKQCDVMNKI